MEEKNKFVYETPEILPVTDDLAVATGETNIDGPPNIDDPLA